MRSHHLRFAAAALTAGLVFYSIARESQATSGCPGPNPAGPGWAPGSKVEFDLSGLPPGAQGAALQAISQWNAALSAGTTTSIQFVPSGEGNGGGSVSFNTAGSIEGPNGNFTLAGINYGSRDSVSNALTQAAIFIDLDYTIDGPNGPVPAYDTSQESDYFNALVGLFMHELGHSLGLGDVPIPNPSNQAACGEYSLENSVMNGYCGTNDKGFGGEQGSQGHLATSCDQGAVTSAYGNWTGGEDEEDVNNQTGTGTQSCYDVWHVTYYWVDNGNGPVYVWKTYDFIIDTWCDGGEPY